METYYKAHCLILPYPIQGHINPMLQFSKRLQNHHGIKITLAATKFLFKTLEQLQSSSSSSSTSRGSLFSIETISDGFDEGGIDSAPKLESYFKTFERVGPETLLDLVLKLQNSGFPVDCIVYDAFLPWAVDVAKKCGITNVAAFFTQSCAVNNIYYHVYKGLLKLPLVENEEIRIPGLPSLSSSDFPSLIAQYGSLPPIFRLVVNQFQNIEKADWVFLNTFYELENEVMEWMSRILAVTSVGPTIPSMYLDKRLKEDNEYGLNMFQPMTDSCIKWLNERSERSVVYVSFGSMAFLHPVQMEELAFGLTSSNKHFLWVVQKSEENKLPKGFLEEKTDKCLILSWCPQLQVLAHKSIGCFITHCGWNSTLEALSLGVPMVAMPQWSDQTTNAKFLVDFWKTGVRARNESGIVKRDEIEKCIKQVMEGEKGKELKINATKWKELATKAVDEGGSSDQNIKEFVSKLLPS
ncbi:hypothetical protein M9H77_25261 [Catharanthus roseus]|uniref:Uncharacterized protein n=1 Tax=Catharanthus roseus TaxID=4058 RepID=A0ACC0AAL4_CATRO|nr:hypothetical protein M9H77_25261 [Catharanthus roseus]